MTDLSTSKLASLIGKRHACLEQLLKLGVKQSELIASGEIGTLLRLLSVKSQLFVSLQSIEQQLSPFHEQKPENRQWDSDQQHQECSRQAGECRELLDQVMRLESENEMKMIQRRDQVSRQLQTAQSSASARKAYHAQDSRPQSNHLALNSVTASPSHLDILTGP